MIFYPVYSAVFVNLALNKQAYMSSNFHKEFQVWPANSVLDGNKASCALGGDEPGGPNWLVVDLGRPYKILSVVLASPPSNCKLIETYIII